MRAALSQLSWHAVLAAEAVGLMVNLLRYLDGWYESGGRVLAMTVFTTVAPLLVVVSALCAAEAVRRGTQPWRAYPSALVAAASCSAGLQYFCRQALAIHPLNGLAPEWIWVGSDFAYVVLLGGIGVLAFYNRVSVQRIRQKIGASELKRARFERELVESRLAAAQAQIDPVALFESLAAIRSLYATTPSAADLAFENLIEQLRRRRAETGVGPAVQGSGA